MYRFGKEKLNVVSLIKFLKFLYSTGCLLSPTVLESFEKEKNGVFLTEQIL